MPPVDQSLDQPSAPIAAQRLFEARNAGTLLDSRYELATLTMPQAYEVQRRLTMLRLAGKRRIVGYKLGYTSAVMRSQMNVNTPNFGPLIDSMMLPCGATVNHLLQPRVEPEIGLVLGTNLTGSDLSHKPLPRLAEAVTEVRACLEVVDSIWEGYRFTAAQNTADGSSAAGVVVGPLLTVDPLHCDRISVDLTIGHRRVATSTAAAAAGHPLMALAWLVDELEHHGRGVRSGDLILTGGLTAAVPLQPGSTIQATFGGGRHRASISRALAR